MVRVWGLLGYRGLGPEIRVDRQVDKRVEIQAEALVEALVAVVAVQQALVSANHVLEPARSLFSPRKPSRDVACQEFARTLVISLVVTLPRAEPLW